MTMDSTERARRQENRRIMREQKNMQQVDGSANTDQTPGAGPSNSDEKPSPSPPKKRKRMDSSSSTSTPRSSALAPYVALKPLDTSTTNNTSQNNTHQGDNNGQFSMDEEVGMTLRILARRKAELEVMKDTIAHQRGEARKKDITVEELKVMVDGLKRTVDELKDAAEAMQNKGRRLEATVERMRSENSAQEMELAKVHLRADALQQEKVKALEGQDKLRVRLAKHLWTPESWSALSKSPRSVSMVDPGPQTEEEMPMASDSGAGDGARKITEQRMQEANEELKEKLEQATELSQKLAEEVRLAKQELEESHRREEELQEANSKVSKEQEDLKKTLSDTLLAHYQIFARQAPKSHIPSENGPVPEEHVPVPVENIPVQEENTSIPKEKTPTVKETTPVAEVDVTMETDGETELEAISAREVQAQDKVRQYKAHNVELKIARDVMRKKLLEIAAAHAELVTTLAQTKTDLAESHKALSESQSSYAAIKKTLFESDATLSRCRAALIKANQDLSKAQERCHQVGTYAESWKSTCVSEREASAHLLSQLTVAGTAVKDAFHRTEGPHMAIDASPAIRQQASMNVKSAIYTLMAIINAEINRRVGQGQNKDWVGLQTIGHSGGTYSGNTNGLLVSVQPSVPAVPAPPMIQIQSNAPPTPLRHSSKESQVT
ncbi:hypothetical protein BDZ94DRAFT_1267864 [Collybia nuda]|uniref:Uncharacterized protein n=1 Tax=Collybia nuda TaxID=64659 RepID=A0A9P5Y1M5_9AGAR|nr:hypothetical protein BDZ94DRAFT_1267864 [Collybia nuda]